MAHSSGEGFQAQLAREVASGVDCTYEVALDAIKQTNEVAAAMGLILNERRRYITPLGYGSRVRHVAPVPFTPVPHPWGIEYQARTTGPPPDGLGIRVMERGPARATQYDRTKELEALLATEKQRTHDLTEVIELLQEKLIKQ